MTLATILSHIHRNIARRPAPFPGSLGFLGLLALVSVVTLDACAPSTRAAPEASTGRLSTSPDVSVADLRARLAVVADDSMQGRAAGSHGNARATAYIAAELERLGLKPAGENGTYYQNVPLMQTAFDESASLSVDGKVFRAWTDYLPRDQGPSVRPIEGAQAVYGGIWGDSASMIPPERAEGKLVVLRTAAGHSSGENQLPPWLVNRAAAGARFPGAVGIAIASLDQLPPELKDFFQQPVLGLPVEAGPAAPVFLYVTDETARALMGAPLEGIQPGAAGRTVRGRVAFAQKPTEAPARNVVAILRGTDPALRGQYVAIGAHNDHVGIAPEPVDHDSLRAFNTVLRPGGAETPLTQPPTPEQLAAVRTVLDSLRRERPPRPDSIFNGADDDGSGTVAVIEIAEAFARGPERPERSILFVWHTAEELGLVGAAHFTEHPTVPRDSIVAQINMDMIGRGRPEDVKGGGPRYVEVIGSRRRSTELGDLVEDVNQDPEHGFQFDYQYDADGHPQNYYCRSDHYAYARFGIPIVFFSTGGHRDYHEVTDEMQYIDYEHWARVTRLIQDVALAAANLDHRLVVDKPKPDPYGPCQQ